MSHWWLSVPNFNSVFKSRGDKGIPRTSMSPQRQLHVSPNVYPVLKSRGDKGIPRTSMSRQRQLHISPDIYPILKYQEDKGIPKILNCTTLSNIVIWYTYLD